MMSLIPQRTHLRSSIVEPFSDTLPFLLREDDACRQILAGVGGEPASTSAQRRRAQEICLTLTASAQMEEEPYYAALRTGRDMSL